MDLNMTNCFNNNSKLSSQKLDQRYHDDRDDGDDGERATVVGTLIKDMLNVVEFNAIGINQSKLKAKFEQDHSSDTQQLTINDILQDKKNITALTERSDSRTAISSIDNHPVNKKLIENESTIAVDQETMESIDAENKHRLNILDPAQTSESWSLEVKCSDTDLVSVADKTVSERVLSTTGEHAQAKLTLLEAEKMTKLRLMIDEINSKAVSCTMLARAGSPEDRCLHKKISFSLQHSSPDREASTTNKYLHSDIVDSALYNEYMDLGCREWHTKQKTVVLSGDSPNTSIGMNEPNNQKNTTGYPTLSEIEKRDEWFVNRIHQVNDEKYIAINVDFVNIERAATVPSTAIARATESFDKTCEEKQLQTVDRVVGMPVSQPEVPQQDVLGTVTPISKTCMDTSERLSSMTTKNLQHLPVSYEIDVPQTTHSQDLSNNEEVGVSRDLLSNALCSISEMTTSNHGVSTGDVLKNISTVVGKSSLTGRLPNNDNFPSQKTDLPQSNPYGTWISLALLNQTRNSGITESTQINNMRNIETLAVPSSLTLDALPAMEGQSSDVKCVCSQSPQIKVSTDVLPIAEVPNTEISATALSQSSVILNAQTELPEDTVVGASPVKDLASKEISVNVQDQPFDITQGALMLGEQNLPNDTMALKGQDSNNWAKADVPAVAFQNQHSDGMPKTSEDPPNYVISLGFQDQPNDVGLCSKHLLDCERLVTPPNNEGGFKHGNSKSVLRNADESAFSHQNFSAVAAISQNLQNALPEVTQKLYESMLSMTGEELDRVSTLQKDQQEQTAMIEDTKEGINQVKSSSVEEDVDMGLYTEIYESCMSMTRSSTSLLWKLLSSAARVDQLSLKTELFEQFITELENLLRLYSVDAESLKISIGVQVIVNMLGILTNLLTSCEVRMRVMIKDGAQGKPRLLSCLNQILSTELAPSSRFDEQISCLVLLSLINLATDTSGFHILQTEESLKNNLLLILRKPEAMESQNLAGELYKTLWGEPESDGEPDRKYQKLDMNIVTPSTTTLYKAES